jgi:hypothetical protein
MTEGFRAERYHGFASDQQGDMYYSPGSDTHGNTKGAPHGISHTSCLAMGRSALLSTELGIYPVWGLRIPARFSHSFRRTSAIQSDGTRPLIPTGIRPRFGDPSESVAHFVGLRISAYS